MKPLFRNDSSKPSIVPVRARTGVVIAAAVAVVAIAVIIVLVGLRPSNEGTDDARLAECREAFEQASYSRAVGLCAESLDRGSPDAANFLAQARYQLGERDEILTWARELDEREDAAPVWRVVATIHDERGEKAQARAARRRALAIARRGRRWSQALQDAYALYTSYTADSEYREALEFASLALHLAEQADDTRWQRHVLLAQFSILYSIGDLDGAEDALRRARKLADQNDVDTWVYIRLNQGIARLGRGELEAARAAYRDVLSIAPPGHPIRPSTRFNLIELAVKLGDLDAAKQHLLAVTTGPDSTEEPNATRRLALLSYRARVAHARGEHPAAETALRQALAGANAGEVPLDWSYDLHNTLGDVLRSRSDREGAEQAYREAISAVETLRATFSDNDLKEWLLEEKRSPYEALFTLQRERGALRQALATAERAKARAFIDAFIAATSTRSESSDLARPTSADRAEALRQLLPDLGASTVVALRPIDSVLQTVGERRVLLYLWAESRLWLIATGDGEPRIQPLEINRDALGQLVRQFLGDPNDPAPANELGAALLPPGALPPAGTTLYIVTDGELGELPFAALSVAGKRVGESHPIAYVPSLNALARLLERPAGTHGPPVVLGDPNRDLPAARTESAEVARSLSTSAVVGQSATTEAVRQAAGAGLLHIASHAGRDARGAWVGLADGRLHADAVLSQRLRPKFVVLASCMSAARRGPGMWGSLGAAFLASGSQAVLASLWSVDDQLARQFVLRFYREGGVTDPVGALARAQRGLATAGSPPSAWASFVLFGTAEAAASR